MAESFTNQQRQDLLDLLNKGTPATKAFGNYDTYAEAVAALEADQTLDESQRKDLINLLAGREYSPGQDLSQFETLLGKLEGSKMRQQRQRSELGRQDIFAQGIANMMTNF